MLTQTYLLFWSYFDPNSQQTLPLALHLPPYPLSQTKMRPWSNDVDFAIQHVKILTLNYAMTTIIVNQTRVCANCVDDSVDYQVRQADQKWMSPKWGHRANVMILLSMVWYLWTGKGTYKPIYVLVLQKYFKLIAVLYCLRSYEEPLGLYWTDYGPYPPLLSDQ